MNTRVNEEVLRISAKRLSQLTWLVLGIFVAMAIGMVALTTHTRTTCSKFSALCDKYRQENTALKQELAETIKDRDFWHDSYSFSASIADSSSGPPPISAPADPEEEDALMSDEAILQQIINQFGSTEESGPGH